MGPSCRTSISHETAADDAGIPGVGSAWRISDVRVPVTQRSMGGFPACDPSRLLCEAGNQLFSVTETPFEAMPFTMTWSVLAPVSQAPGTSNVALVVPEVHTPMVEKL